MSGERVLCTCGEEVKMYKVLIVDDEVMIRRGLSKIIKWNQIGFEVVGTVGDGQEALTILREKVVDVLLTDISMPGLSGLELIRLSKGIRPRIKIVVISGYSEFDYAVEALRLRAENYILKPLDPKKITDIFKALKEDLDEWWKNAQKEHYIKSEYEIFWNVGTVNKGGQEKYWMKMIQMLEDGRYGEMDPFVEELFASLEHGDVDAREYCLKALRNVALYFHLEDSFLYRLYRLSEEESKDMGSVKNCFREDMHLLMGYLHDNSESLSTLISRQAHRYVEEHYGDKALSLRDVAENLGISYGYLSTAFAKTYGQNFKNYLTSVRMEKARELLMERRYKIYEIADRTGYGSSRYFTDAFKRCYGISPMDYLRRLNHGNGE